MYFITRQKDIATLIAMVTEKYMCTLLPDCKVLHKNL